LRHHSRARSMRRSSHADRVIPAASAIRCALSRRSAVVRHSMRALRPTPGRRVGLPRGRGGVFSGGVVCSVMSVLSAACRPWILARQRILTGMRCALHRPYRRRKAGRRTRLGASISRAMRRRRAAFLRATHGLGGWPRGQTTPGRLLLMVFLVMICSLRYRCGLHPSAPHARQTGRSVRCTSGSHL